MLDDGIDVSLAPLNQYDLNIITMYFSSLNLFPLIFSFHTLTL